MSNLSKLSDTLNEILAIRGLTKSSLAEGSDIPVSCISQYANGKQAPYLDTLIKLADYLHCSIEYLLGRTDDCSEKIYKPCPPFGKRLEELRKKKNYTSQYIYSQDGISKSSYYSWRRGESSPTLENLVTLAKVFDCSVDELLGREG
ncbi:MAG: helix-turn-helix transcriptional regulator [Clostridia bacterium]|nr:helix-turn-helix transcriptional regulator [Clostridia bacterium]